MGLTIRRFLPHPFPFVLAVVSVTALVAANPGEGIRVVNLKTPIGVALCTAVIAWCIAGLLTRDRARQALLAFAMMSPLLVSGYVFKWLRNSQISGSLGAVLEVGLLALFIASASTVILRRQAPGPTTMRFLNIFSLSLLVFTLPAVGRLLLPEEERVGGEAGVSLTVDRNAALPDIYFILLDSYTGMESMADIHGRDLSNFARDLSNRGFVLSERPRSNYILTFLSLGSMLNREYADQIVGAAAPGYSDRRGALEWLEFNRTVLDLKSLGYTFAFVGSSYPPLARNRLADVQYPVSVSSEFEHLWYTMTGIPPILRAVCFKLDCHQPIPFAESGEKTKSRLAFLNDLAELPGPKFVYAHWLLPHGPYRLGPDCESITPRWVFGHNPIQEDSVDRRMYWDQMQCTNRMVLQLIDTVRAASTSTSEPIIIFQSDHGHGRFGNQPPSLAEAAPEQIAERFDIFAAYAGPGSLPDSLASNRTPVNLFRTLFRVLWGVNELPLRDLHYWSDPDRPLALHDVAID